MFWLILRAIDVMLNMLQKIITIISTTASTCTCTCVPMIVNDDYADNMNQQIHKEYEIVFCFFSNLYIQTFTTLLSNIGTTFYGECRSFNHFE